MKRTPLLLVLLAAACAAIAGDSSGAAASYPTPLELRSTASAVTGTWKLDTSTGTADSTTNNVPAQNDTGWYAFDPGTSVTTRLASIPTTPDGKGWIIDPAGGATGFPAGNWSFTVKTDVPDATLTAGTAVLTVGIWKGTMSGGSFTATGTILTPTDDPAATDLRSSVSPVTTTATYSLAKFSIAAGETLFVDFWRHQSGGINDATASRRQLDFVVNDGVAQVSHPAADDTGPTHSLTITAVSGSTTFNSGSSTLYYNGGSAGSFKVNDTITDSGSGPYSVNYPLVSTSGWTHANETVTTGPSYQSSTYSWTSGSTTSPGAQTITGEDTALQTSTATLTLTNDTTGPTGQTVALSGGPGYSTLSVPLTLANGSDSGSGLNGSSGVVERATATLADGACGSFGSFSTVTLSSNADTTVASGSCYRYQYKISDSVGNQSAASSASADAKVDTSAPTVSNTAPAEVTGAGDQYYDAATDTLWFRPAAAGSFTLSATGSDSQSGIAQIAFPDVSATTGWTGSTGGSDTSTPYASPTTYTWAASASAPGAKQVTATNGTSLTSTDTITISADSTAPAGGSVALSGGPWYTALSVPLTLTNGTDTGGSGVDATRAIVERASAPLASGACGTFGSFSAVTLTGGADTTVASGSCYRYQHKATDNVGNVSSASAASADAKVDTTAPRAPTLSPAAVSNAAATGTTVFYRPGTAGRFTITAAATDAESGVASYSFPALAGWATSGTGSTRTYSFAGTPAEPGDGQSVTATSNAGLVSAATTFSVRADSTPPAVTVRCNGGFCSSLPYRVPVTIALAASDAGAGVDEIRYTTNRSEPTLEDGESYQDAFTVTALTTIKVRAYDRVGNTGPVKTLVVRYTPPRLAFSAPARVSVPLASRYLEARVRASQSASVTATMTGPGLERPERWRFALRAGASIVQLRLPEGRRTAGRYKLVWTARADKRKVTRTTRIELGAARPPKRA